MPAGLRVPRRSRHLDDALRALVRALVAARAVGGVAAPRVRYRDFLVVALMLNAEKLFPDNWIYIHTRA